MRGPGGFRGGDRGRGGGGGFRGGDRGGGGFRGGRGGDRGRGGGRGGRGGGRFGGRGGAGRGGKPGPRAIVVEPHAVHPGIFISRGKEDTLCTLNLAPGVSVYGEKRITAEVTEGEKKEYRVWNPYRSKLAAAIVGGVDHCYIEPGTKVLYLGAASGTTVSHVSDIVGPTGVVYAVEFSHRSGRDLVEMAKRRPNVIPIVADARNPKAYRMLVGMVDTIFMDVAQPDQARILALNAKAFLKVDGHFVISIKAPCIDSTLEAAVVFASEVEKMKAALLKPREQITLEPFERDHAVVVGIYRPSKSKKTRIEKSCGFQFENK